MTKNEFVDRVAENSGLGKGEAAKAVDAVLESIQEVLSRGGDINFTGFGKFSVADRSARQGVNPQTGEKIQIAASRVPRFSAGSSLKKRSQERRLETASPAGESLTAGGSTPHFADRLAALVEERRSRVVLGLDPDPAALWPEAVERVGGDPGAARLARAHTAEAVTEHCRAAIVAAGPACVAVKPQLACFERLGAPGWDALEQVAAIARDHGLLVLADGKRGDVPVTARAYAQALVGETPGPFGPVQGLGADAFTANPLLGRDALEPLVDAAADAGAGCFVLVRTSNPGAAEIQDEGDPPLHERLARLVDELGRERLGRLRALGGRCGHGRHAAGAPRPPSRADAARRVPAARSGRPGRQGRGSGAAFAPHPAAGLVTASRSIVNAHAERGGEPAAAAAEAAEELRAAAWDL